MAEKECIEREAVLDILTNRDVVINPNDEVANIREDIERLPAADVRPVVLCQDCKYAPIGDKDGSDLEWPFNEFDENPCPYKCLDNWYSHKPAPDFFCAAGEKDGENNAE